MNPTLIYTNAEKCRLSGTGMIPIMNLGNMALTGVFPKTPDEYIPSGPVTLMYAPDSGLVQLKESYNPDLMYGDNYGYRSGLNDSMVRHLQAKVAHLQKICPVDAEDTVLDIGGNDGTLLKAYNVAGLKRYLVDPTACKWLEHYVGTDLFVQPTFFNSSWSALHGKAKIITSIAMFYDLEDPKAFVLNVKKSLAHDGIWHFEQSYLPAMINATAYDTICHEHLEYYSFSVVYRLLASCGMKVVDVELNKINGGSFAVTATHSDSPVQINFTAVNDLLKQEAKINWLATLRNFEARSISHRNKLRSLLHDIRNQGKVVGALGASTKGNVLLQFCHLTNKDIAFVGDVNPLKHGCFTPGTKIPIISEELARAYNPDFMLVLPWHFRDGIIEREHEYLKNGGHLIFPLPEIEII